MKKTTYPPEFLKQLAAVKNKRAKAVIDHILQTGFVTTEEIQKLGYEHPPRAARDVRELGIPLETFFTNRSSTGRRMASYKFGDLSKIRHDRIGGRTAFAKDFKSKLIEQYGQKCNICSGNFEKRYLQIDHRVPYEVGGDSTENERSLEHYQLLDGSCNRAKSWSCEHCQNWIELKEPGICSTCYWAVPESYKHVAMRNIRRLDVIWDEHEIDTYQKIQELAEREQIPVPDFVKAVLKDNLE